MSELKDKINADLKAAMIARDTLKTQTLQGLKAAILNEEVAQGKRDEGLSDADIEKVIAREAKKRVESAKVYRDNNRPELAEPEEQELVILQQYLPKQMTEDELRAIVKEKIAELGATSPVMMGQVIGAVKQAAGNTADGAVVAQIVKQELN